MKVLNLYSGLGGNRKNWTGVKVTAVENDPKIAAVYASLFPEDDLIIGDAHQYLLDHYDKFDIIWGSPPCPTHSCMMKATRHRANRYPDMALYQEIIFLQHFFKGKWVVENVKPYYDPLVQPTAILGRHYFWSNFEIKPFKLPNHPGFIAGTNTVEQTKQLKEWLGIHYEGNLYHKGNHDPGQVLRNCVHPKTGEHILNCLLQDSIPEDHTQQLHLFAVEDLKG